MQLTETYPVLLSQEQRLIAQEVLTANGILYEPEIRVGALALHGPLCNSTLTKAVNDVIGRHHGLWTILEKSSMADDQRAAALDYCKRSGIVVSNLYCQRPVKPARIRIEHLDWSSVELQVSDRTRTLVASETVRFFDYSKPPFIRILLARIEPEQHLLFFVVDHIVTDAWSMHILMRDITARYATLSGFVDEISSEPSGQAPLYALQQAQEEFQEALAFWRDQWVKFGSARVAYEAIAFAKHVKPGSSLGATIETVGCPPQFSTQLRKFAQRAGVTLHMLFLACVATLFKRYSCAISIAFWTHFSGRTGAYTQNMVAPLNTTHLIGFDFEHEPTWMALLAQSRSVVASGIAHQRMPLALMWRQLQCSPRHQDAFLMVITNAASGKLFDAKMGDSLVAEHVDLPEIPRRALLTFTLDETPKALNLQVMYQEMRFEAGVMRRVLEDLQSTLEHCAAAPDAVATNGPVLNFNSENMQRASARMDEFTIFSPNMLPYPVRSRPDHNITATGTPGKAIWEV